MESDTNGDKSIRTKERAQNSDLESGSYSVVGGSIDITPENPTVLGGNKFQDVVSEIRDSLECNALIICQGSRKVLLLTFDLLYIGEEIRQRVLTQLEATYRPEDILLAASHTHSAPAVDTQKPQLGAADLSYIESTSHKVVGLVNDLEKRSPTPCDIEVRIGLANHSVNRRLKRFRLQQVAGKKLRIARFGLGPNPNGPRDENITLVTFSHQGQPLAYLWNYACHPTSAPLPPSVSAHFPGAVRANLRQDESSTPAVPVLFLQGFSGDIRPPSVRKIRNSRDFARRIVLGPNFGPFEMSEYQRWSSSLANVVRNIKNKPPFFLDGQIRSTKIDKPRSQIVTGSVSESPLTFQAIQIGQLTIAGISAEVVCEFAPLVREMFVSKFVLPTGCIDNVVGYVSTKQMYSEKGYEVTGFCPEFGVDAVRPEMEQAVLSGFEQLAASIESS